MTTFILAWLCLTLILLLTLAVGHAVACERDIAKLGKHERYRRDRVRRKWARRKRMNEMGRGCAAGLERLEYSEGTGWPFEPPAVGAGRMHRMFDN